MMKRDDCLRALARHIGDKRAREMWFLNEQYTAQQAYEMGLVNKVVPFAELDAAVKAWTDILAERSPTALALAKRSFNADSENIRGISLAMLSAVKLFYETEESKACARSRNDASPTSTNTPSSACVAAPSRSRRSRCGSAAGRARAGWGVFGGIASAGRGRPARGFGARRDDVHRRLRAGA